MTWRKQLIKQAKACCNIEWGLSRMHDPEQIAVWLDAFADGELHDRGGRLLPRRLWPVQLPKDVGLLDTTTGMFGTTSDSYVLMEEDDEQLIVNVFELARFHDPPSSMAIDVMGGVGELRPRDLVEGELAYRFYAQRLAEDMQLSEYEPRHYMSAELMSPLTKKTHTRTYAYRDETYDGTDNWMFMRQLLSVVASDELDGNPARQGSVHIAIGRLAREWWPVLDELLVQPGLPKPIIIDEGEDVYVYVDYSLRYPRFNPWTMRRKP